ncbi:MAG: type II secretion system F family protein [Nanoarchaeota archaeon]|nr:type II secretion system F family protein [Nanoarchaeota archaeon]MBU4086863.1 type II secretion system F family protein [Nanoarchaeota archaeon]
MNIEKKHIVGIIGAVIIMLGAVIFLRDSRIFYFVLGIGGVVAILPFIVSLALDSRIERENNEMFLEFARNLAEAVKSGTPISRSIMNVRTKFYGSLTPYVQKLANQIALGIPVKDALNTFASDVNSSTVTRAINLISEAEKAGGKIEDILDSVSKSVAEIEKLKKERRSAIYSLVVQGYIIFFIFIIIMLVLQFKILPMATEFGDMSGGDIEGLTSAGLSSGGQVSAEEMSRPFLYLLLSQGFFAGLIIGKLAEGRIKPGLKHSFVMMIVAYLITTGVKAFI